MCFLSLVWALSVVHYAKFNTLHSLFIIGLIIVGTIYFILLDFLSFIFSIRLCATISSLTTDNFKCGFYSILTSSLRYRYNYWMIIIHFLIFEQELILALFWIYSITINLNSNNLCCLLLSILFMEIIINYTLFIFLVLAIITLTFSFNNVILLFNFLSIIFIFSFSLLVFNYILITLLIFIIYSSLLSILFLVNGLLVINSLSFKNYINFRLLINYVCWA